MFIALLNKVKTKIKPKIFRFFNPSEDHMNAGEDIVPQRFLTLPEQF